MRLQYLAYVGLAFLAVFLSGIGIGRFACCPKPKPYDIVLTPAEDTTVSGGAGVMVPEEPVIGPSVTGPGPGEILPLGSASWYKYDDAYINIRTRAVRAESVTYKFKKRWHEFTPEEPYVASLLVFGVAPDSVRVQGNLPQDPTRSNFDFDLYLFGWFDLTFDGIATLTYKRVGIAAKVGSQKLILENRETTELKWNVGLAVKVF